MLFTQGALRRETCPRHTAPMVLASRSDQLPVSPAASAIDRSAPGKVTGRLKIAVNAMVWQGLTRADAAKAANLTEHALYSALRKAHVRQHYLNELEVLRTSERARNIHALAEVRDGTNQMARVAAVKALEQLSEDNPMRSAGSIGSPGLTIQVIHMSSVNAIDTQLTQPQARIVENDEGSA